jgi:hypothetical protein
MSAGKNFDPATLERLRKLSNLLDNAIGIPGTPFSIGLDSILGLIPGGGDIIGGIFSAYIVFTSARMGLPKETLVRMVLNIVLDILIGTVPVLGDLMDFAWKANTKNMELLETNLKYPQPTTKKADRSFIILLLVGLILFVLAVAVVSATLIGVIVKLIAGGS